MPSLDHAASGENTALVFSLEELLSRPGASRTQVGVTPSLREKGQGDGLVKHVIFETIRLEDTSVKTRGVEKGGSV